MFINFSEEFFKNLKNTDGTNFIEKLKQQNLIDVLLENITICTNIYDGVESEASLGDTLIGSMSGDFNDKQNTDENNKALKLQFLKNFITDDENAKSIIIKFLIDYNINCLKNITYYGDISQSMSEVQASRSRVSFNSFTGMEEYTCDCRYRVLYEGIIIGSYGVHQKRVAAKGSNPNIPSIPKKMMLDQDKLNSAIDSMKKFNDELKAELFPDDIGNDKKPKVLKINTKLGS